MPSARLLTKMINSRLNSFGSRLGVHCTQLDACLLYHSCWSFTSFVPIGWGWWEMPGHWQQRSFQFRIWRSSCNGEKMTYFGLIKTLWLCCSVPGLNVGKPETEMLWVFISVQCSRYPGNRHVDTSCKPEGVACLRMACPKSCQFHRSFRQPDEWPSVMRGRELPYPSKAAACENYICMTALDGFSVSPASEISMVVCIQNLLYFN